MPAHSPGCLYLVAPLPKRERERRRCCASLPATRRVVSGGGQAAVFITGLIWLVAVAVVPFRGASQNFHFSAFSHPQPASDQRQAAQLQPALSSQQPNVKATFFRLLR